MTSLLFRSQHKELFLSLGLYSDITSIACNASKQNTVYEYIIYCTNVASTEPSELFRRIRIKDSDPDPSTALHSKMSSKSSIKS